MNQRLESCPSCGGKLLFALGSLPTGAAHQGDKFETDCPHCEEQILIGYVSEYRRVTSPVPEPKETSASSGGGSGHMANPANDDRSNALNPNNPAHGAARDNRANQLNPNNRAFRSSPRR